MLYVSPDLSVLLVEARDSADLLVGKIISVQGEKIFRIRSDPFRIIRESLWNNSALMPFENRNDLAYLVFEAQGNGPVGQLLIRVMIRLGSTASSFASPRTESQTGVTVETWKLQSICSVAVC